MSFALFKKAACSLALTLAMALFCGPPAAAADDAEARTSFLTDSLALSGPLSGPLPGQLPDSLTMPADSALELSLTSLDDPSQALGGSEENTPSYRAFFEFPSLSRAKLFDGQTKPLKPLKPLGPMTFGGFGLADPTDGPPAAPARAAAEAPEPLVPLAADRQQAYLSGGRLFNDGRLALSGGLLWERLGYDAYLTRNERPPISHDALTFDFGAGLRLDDDLTLGASLSLSEVDELSAKVRLLDSRLSFAERAGSAWLGRAELRYDDRRRGLTLGVSGYAGSRTSPADGGRLDLQGVEVNVQRRLLDGQLTVMAAAMLNYFNDSRAILSHRGEGRLFNMSSYLGLTYDNSSLINASFFLRYAGDGNYLQQELIRRIGPQVFFDARLWRDWPLSPALTLSTQFYGSNLADDYAVPNPASPYLESRVTMSYSF
ncbi:MAG: hypothetical protein LBU12_08345 [Deltaproteobacteria bacterium]|jgi:hypothetical protein|nr:hypothetical protein [Deltaproteobacteria bacterium]